MMMNDEKNLAYGKPSKKIFSVPKLNDPVF